MKVSQIGLISKKIDKLDDQFKVLDMLIKTGQLEQFSSGIYAYGHVPYLLKKNIDRVICEVLTKHGASEMSLPILQPESIWIESGRLERYVEEDVIFQVDSSKGKYCLAPTAEEAVVKYAKSRLFSYKQLPVNYFQIGQKFRNEIRTRGFLLRGKAFDMLDAYSFGRNQEDLDIEYSNMRNAYFEIFKELGLEVQTVGADNGSIGGNKSEEFMCISNIGEDNILLDTKTGKALNVELLEKENYKEYLKETYDIENIDNLEKRKAVELGHIFQLGDKYATSMNANYIDEFGKSKPFVMGCYGIGVSRTLAMIYENSIILKDNKFDGISLPINISPYLLYIVPKLDDTNKLEISKNVYNKLLENKVSVLYDDRLDLSIGAKIKDSKIVGTPYVVVFGKTLDQDFVEIENTKTNEKTMVNIEKLIELFTKLENNRNSSIEELIKEV